MNARAVLTAALLLASCATSTHPTELSKLGVARSTADLLAVIDAPGPLEVETIASCDWSVPKSGLINLEHAKAKAAQLEDADEPIQVYFHAIRHPQRGMYIVDTGIERALRDDPDHSALRGPVATFMHLERMKIHMPLADWLAKQDAPLSGVLMTHLHLDHIAGMPDVPKTTPIYTGPGEAASSQFLNFFVQVPTDRALAGHGAIREWQFGQDGVIDVFGDGSLWALWVPGHTPGSTAYLARTKNGPVLFTGDASHTVWGWKNGVEPGTFSSDQPESAKSLDRLERLVAAHPSIDVRLGHQDAHGTNAHGTKVVTSTLSSRD